jgi:hypothetical protein
VSVVDGGFGRRGELTFLKGLGVATGPGTAGIEICDGRQSEQ